MGEKQVFKGHVMSESHKSVKMCHLAPWEYDLYMLSSSNYCYTVVIVLRYCPKNIRLVFWLNKSIEKIQFTQSIIHRLVFVSFNPKRISKMGVLKFC